MINLCYGMKVINISQLPYSSFSHPNGAMDMCGSDNGVDFWFAQGDWKCIAGPWGNGTYFFTHVDSNGRYEKVHCADGTDRYVTIALTHSEERYVDTVVGRIYKNGKPMYEEGKKGFATGNHIHYEVAEGIQTTKHYDSSLKVWRMYRELNPVKVTYVNKSFSTIKNSKGLILPVVNTITYYPPKDQEDEPMYFYADKMPCRIRAKLEFKDGKPVGKILATMPKGSKALITHFTNRHEKDAEGFEWFQVKYETPSGEIIEGYVQGDLGAYLVKRV